MLNFYLDGENDKKIITKKIKKLYKCWMAIYKNNFFDNNINYFILIFYH